MGIMADIQACLATIIGKISVSKNMVGIWPWPLITIGSNKSLVNCNDYRCFSALLQPGDMIVTTQKRAKGANTAIPGSFKHLMVFTGAVFGSYDNDKKEITKPQGLGIHHKFTLSYAPDIFQRTITHAEAEGVGTFDLLDIYYNYDYLAVIRPWTTKEQQKIIVDTALSQVGKEYNFVFLENNDKSLYCTQLGMHCLQKAGIDTPKMIKKMTRFWKPWEENEIIVSDSYIEKYKVICTTLSCNDPRFAKDTIIGDVMREKLLNAPDANSRSEEVIDAMIRA